MKLIENPYEPTVLSSLPAKSLVVSGFRKYLVSASKFVFWIGVMKFLLGSMISFMPGAETIWFIITAGLVSAGFFASGKYYRITALVIVAICVLWAYSGYYRGIEYQQRRKAKSHRQSLQGSLVPVKVKH